MSWDTRPIEEFGQIERDWSDLNREVSDTPLLDVRFVKALLHEFSTGDEVIALFRRDGVARAVGIFRRTNRFAWQTMQPANAPLGLWINAPDIDTPELLPSLARRLSPQCMILGITQQDPLINARPEESPRIATADYITTAHIQVTESFSAHLNSRSKNFRHNVKRQKNRLEREGLVARLETMAHASAQDRAVADFSRLENSGWKGSIDSSFEIDSAQGRFYRDILGAFAATNEAFCYEYLFDDVVVACDLCLRRADTLYILKTAYDEARKGYSPAHLMRVDLFMETLDALGIRRVEFYGPVMDWHTKLTDQFRTMYHVNYYRWPQMRRLHDLARRRRITESVPASDEARS